MNKKTLKALEGSIRKWEKIVDGSGEDRGPHNCPFCELFFWENHCVGCPVEAAIGKKSCHGTPYHDFLDARSHAGDEERKQASNMLSFLKSLLPRGK